MKTFLGLNDISNEVRGVLYLCKYDYEKNSLIVFNEILFNNAGESLQAYCDIPNPESQVAYGNTFEELQGELEKLHENMRNKEWLKSLADAL